MNTLIIFIKNPIRGKVKTRIAQTAGDDRALQIYHSLLQHTRAVAMPVEAKRLLFYSDFIDTNDDWPQPDFDKRLQQGTNLGERMQNAFAQALSAAERAIIIGSDCALLTSALVTTAFQQLNDHDFVLGPATDGGYYLLGMKELTPALFQDIAWSTDTVLPATLQRIENLRKSCFLLPALPDIDHESDWQQYGWEDK